MNAPLSTGGAVLASAAVTVSYVGSLYVFAAHRIGRAGSARYNDATVIRHRLQVASLSTAVSFAGCAAFVKGRLGSSGWGEALRLLGVPLPALTWASVAGWARGQVLPAAALPLALTALLYAGSLYACFLDGALPFQRGFDVKKAVVERATTLQGLRTFVVGPLTEELVFRSCVLAASLCGGWRRASLIFATPAYFSIAHVHHGWEDYNAEGRTPQALRRSFQRAVFQMLYTAVFGWYANFLFLRTGNVVAPLLSHVFCNVMGLPDLAGAASRHPDRRRALRAMHIGGIAAFVACFAPLTRPALFGGTSLWV